MHDRPCKITSKWTPKFKSPLFKKITIDFSGFCPGPRGGCLSTKFAYGRDFLIFIVRINYQYNNYLADCGFFLLCSVQDQPAEAEP
jgi:hypothetical protein